MKSYPHDDTSAVGKMEYLLIQLDSRQNWNVTNVCWREEENEEGFVVKVHQGAEKWMTQWHEKLRYHGGWHGVSMPGMVVWRGTWLPGVQLFGMVFWYNFSKLLLMPNILVLKGQKRGLSISSLIMMPSQNCLLRANEWSWGNQAVLLTQLSLLSPLACSLLNLVTHVTLILFKAKN
jgi:hypothetical protein